MHEMIMRNLIRMGFPPTLKSPVFSLLFTISVATIFVVYENIVIANIYMHLEGLSTTTQEVDMQVVDLEIMDPLSPPFNVTREERIAWFKKKVQRLELFESRNPNSGFHDRVSGFFVSNCTVRYFMVWLSPARSFGAKEFLAVDSLFKANPQGCLVILSPSLDSTQGYMILKPATDRGFKVLAVTPDLPFLVKDTPAESWLDELKTGGQDPGQISLSYNLSNLIRLAILYKYGGVYLDVDFIVLKDFNGLRNGLGAQSMSPITRKWSRINGAAMIFDQGHPVLNEFLEEFAKTFDGNKWGHNGPYLISRVIERVENKPGYNVTILPPRTFYPMDWMKIGRCFTKPRTESERKWVEDVLVELESSTYAMHIWNHRTKELRIEDQSVMERLISSRCVVCQQRNLLSIR